MSSSDEDFEVSEPTPSAAAVGETNWRKRGRKISNRKSVPKKKKKRSPFGDFNDSVEGCDKIDDMDDSGRKKQGQKRNRVSSSSPSSSESSLENYASSRTPQVAGVPGANAVNITEGTERSERGCVPERRTEEGRGRDRPRKRLSIRSDVKSANPQPPATVTSDAPRDEHNYFATAKDVKDIYETHSQMFVRNKINSGNAFSLKLLDLINDMVDSPGYDKSDMQLTSGTLEIGTKIYACRVENTLSHALSLASDITLQKRRKMKDGVFDNDDEGIGMINVREKDDVPEVEYFSGRRQKQKGRSVKKRGRYVEEDNKKLLIDENQGEGNAKFATRRNMLHKKFSELIDEDIDFDYLSYTLDPKDYQRNPLYAKDEMKNLDETCLELPDYLKSSADICRMTFLPFVNTSMFDPEMQDVWGFPLNGAESLLPKFSFNSQLPITGEFTYTPENRPQDYHDNSEPSDAVDTSVIGDFSNNETDATTVSFNDISNLDRLDNYFQSVASRLSNNTWKHGWCGPQFVASKVTWSSKKREGKKKSRVKKQQEPIDFTKLNWNDKANRFNLSAFEKTIHDNSVFEKYRKERDKIPIPYLGIEITSYDDDFHPDDFANEEDPSRIPNVFRLFTVRNRSILNSKSRSKKNDFQSVLASLQETRESAVSCEFNDNDDDCGTLDVQNRHDQSINVSVSTFMSDAQSQFLTTVGGITNNDSGIESGVESNFLSIKPKPIDMRNLKICIFTALVNQLHLDAETGQPLGEKETKIDLADLMLHVLKSLDPTTEKLLSVPIFVVALMHVVGEKKLLVMYDDMSDPTCPVILCRGKKFNHLDQLNSSGNVFK